MHDNSHSPLIVKQLVDRIPLRDPPVGTRLDYRSPQRKQQQPASVFYPADYAPANPFPTHCLPPPIAAMASAISQSVLVPERLSGCCVLGILSASLGKGIQVQSGSDRCTRGNLYLMASADSGTGKSETFRHSASRCMS
jgi:hypothetical protein